MPRKRQIDEIKRIITENNTRLGNIVPGKQRWTSKEPSNMDTGYQVDQNQGANFSWSVLYIDENIVRCSSYYPIPIGSNGTCIGSGSQDPTASGCYEACWQKDGLCIFGNRPSMWGNPTLGELIASGFSPNDMYLFDELDILRSSDIKYKVITSTNGDFIDSHIPQNRNVRYSTDIRRSENGTVKFGIKTYGESAWRVEVNGLIVANSTSRVGEDSEVEFFVGSGSWYSVDIYYVAKHYYEASNRIEIYGDILSQIDHFRFPADLSAPYDLAATQGTMDKAIQLNWDSDYVGPNAYTAIFVSGSVDQATNFPNWELIDLVPLSIFSYIDDNLYDGEIRYYRLRHLNLNGDVSDFSDVISGYSRSIVSAKLKTVSVVANDDSTRNTIYGRPNGTFASTDTITITMQSNVPLSQQPDVWLYTQNGIGGQISTLATYVSQTGVGYMETTYTLDLSYLSSANDGLAFVVASGSTLDSMVNWNVSNANVGILFDAPNGLLTIDNLGPTSSTGGAPEIELLTGYWQEGSGLPIAIDRNVTIQPTRNQVTGRPNVIDNETISPFFHGDLYQARFLNSGTGGPIGDWSDWEPYSEGSIRAWILPDSDEPEISGNLVYVYAQFRDRVYNTHDPVYASVVIDTVAPAAPTGLVASGGLNVVDVNFIKNSEPDMYAYYIYASDDSAVDGGGDFISVLTGYPKIAMQPGSTSSRVHFIDFVPGNTIRYYQVSAVDYYYNESARSVVASGSTADTVPPATPSWAITDPLISWVEIDLDSQTQVSYIQATWIANAESDLKGYKFEYKPSTGDGWSQLDVDVDGTVATVEVTPGLIYYCRVKAYDTLGNISDPSSELNILASGDVTPPGECVNLELSSAVSISPEGFLTSTISALWDSPPDNDIKGYYAELSVSGAISTYGWNRVVVDHVNGVTADYGCTFQNLESDTVYVVRVAAFDLVGNVGPFISGYAYGGRDYNPPVRPTGLSADSLYNQAWLTWDDNYEVDLFKYYVLRSDSLTVPYVTSGFLIQACEQGDGEVYIDVISDAAVVAGRMLSISPDTTNEDNIIVSGYNSTTGLTGLSNFVKYSHNTNIPIRIYDIRSSVYASYFIDSTTSTRYYCVCAVDKSSNISRKSNDDGAWVSCTPVTIIDTSLDIGFLQYQTTINMLKNGSFEIGSGTLDADKRDIFWSDYCGTPTTEDIKTDFGIDAAFGRTVAKLDNGDGYYQIVQIQGDTPYVLSFYGCSSAGSGTSKASMYLYYSLDGSSWDFKAAYLTDALVHYAGGFDRFIIYDEVTSGGYVSASYHRYAKIIVSGYNTTGGSRYAMIDGIMFQAGNNVTQYIDYSDEFVLGTECITGVEITSGSITAPKIAADSVLAKHILAGQIGTYHLTAAMKPMYFNFGIIPNWLGTRNTLGITWSGGKVLLPSGAGAPGNTAATCYIENTVPSGNWLFSSPTGLGSKVYYPYLEYDAVTSTSNGFIGEPINGHTAYIRITDVLSNTISNYGVSPQKRLLGYIEVFENANTEMTFKTVYAGTTIDGRGISALSINGVSISSDTLTSRHIQAYSISGYHLSADVLTADRIISIINAHATYVISGNRVEGLGDQDPPDFETPFSFTATAQSDGSIKLSWVAATDSDSGLDGYKIWRIEGSSHASDWTLSSLVADVKAESAVNPYEYWDDSAELVQGQAYTYWVSAYDKNGNETTPPQRMTTPSTPTGVTVNDTTAPGIVTKPDGTAGFEYAGGIGRIILRWRMPSDKDIAYVKIERYPGTGSFTDIAHVTGCTFTDFISNVSEATAATYQYRLTVVDVDGNTSSSSVTKTTSGMVGYVPGEGGGNPSPPTKYSTNGYALDGDGGITLQFVEPTDATKTSIESYRIKVVEKNLGTIVNSGFYDFYYPYNGYSYLSYHITGLKPKFGYPRNEINDYYYDFSIYSIDTQGNVGTTPLNYTNVYVYDYNVHQYSTVNNFNAVISGFGVQLSWSHDPTKVIGAYIHRKNNVDSSTYPTWTDKDVVIRVIGSGYHDNNLRRFDTSDRYYSYAAFSFDKFDNYRTVVSGNVIGTRGTGNKTHVRFDNHVGADDVAGWARNDGTPANFSYIEGGKIYTGTVTADRMSIMSRKYTSNMAYDIIVFNFGFPAVQYIRLRSFIGNASSGLTNAWIWIHGEPDPISVSSIPWSTGLSTAYPLSNFSSDGNIVYIYYYIPGVTNEEKFVLKTKTEHDAIVALDMNGSACDDYLLLLIADISNISNIHYTAPYGNGTDIDGAWLRTGEIDANRFKADSISVNKLLIGSTANLLNEYQSVFESLPSGWQGYLTWPGKDGVDSSIGDFIVNEDTATSSTSIIGKKSAYMKIKKSGEGSRTIAFLTKNNDPNSATYTQWYFNDPNPTLVSDISIEPGTADKRYVLSAYIKIKTPFAPGSTTPNELQAYVGIQFYKANGSKSTGFITSYVNYSAYPNKWQRTSVVCNNIPYDVTSARIYLGAYGGGHLVVQTPNAEVFFDAIQLEYVGSSGEKSEPGPFMPPSATYIDGSGIRTGRVDANLVSIRGNTFNEDYPVIIGKVNSGEDTGLDKSGLILIGKWDSAQTPGSVSVPPSGGMLVAHGDSATLVSNQGFFRIDDTGVIRHYKTYTARHECGILDAYGTGTGTSYFGSLLSYISDVSIFQTYWVPSGGAKTTWGSSIGDGDHNLYAPKYVVDFLESLSNSDRVKYIRVSAGDINIMPAGSSSNQVSDTLGKMAICSGGPGAGYGYFVHNSRYISYSNLRTVCGLSLSSYLGSSNFLRVDDTHFRVKVDAYVMYYDIRAAGTTPGNWDVVTPGYGLLRPAYGSPARGGILSTIVSINV